MTAPSTTGAAASDRALKIDHEFKSHPSVFWPAAYGQKMFEYRRDDRGGYEVGQIVRLRLWHGDTGYADVPPVDRRITNILRGGEFELPAGYCVLGLAPLDVALAPSAVVPESVRRLSEAASPGEWRLGRLGIETQPHVVDMGEPPKSPFMVFGKGMPQEGGFRGQPAYGAVHSDDGSSAANAAFIVGLVNWFRGLSTPSRRTDTPPAGGGAVPVSDIIAHVEKTFGARGVSALVREAFALAKHLDAVVVSDPAAPAAPEPAAGGGRSCATLRIEWGREGLFYVTSPDVKGLLVAEHTVHAALSATPKALSDLASAGATLPSILSAPSEAQDAGEESPKIGTPVQAIEFALKIDDHYDMREFLSSWIEGDIGEWPEFAAAIAPPPTNRADAGAEGGQ